MNDIHQQLTIQSSIEFTINQGIVRTFFPKNSSIDVSVFKFQIRFKDSSFLKILFFPKKIYRNYYLIVQTHDNQYQTKINFKEKEIIKTLLKLIEI
jgi:hypothetical protein